MVVSLTLAVGLSTLNYSDLLVHRNRTLVDEFDVERRTALMETYVLLGGCVRRVGSGRWRRELRAVRAGVGEIVRFFWGEPSELSFKVRTHMPGSLFPVVNLLDCAAALQKNVLYSFPGSDVDDPARAWLRDALCRVRNIAHRAAPSPWPILPSPSLLDSPTPSPTVDILYQGDSLPPAPPAVPAAELALARAEQMAAIDLELTVEADALFTS